MAARLQRASRGGRPVLLRIATPAAARAQRDAEGADEQAFLLWQMVSRTTSRRHPDRGHPDVTIAAARPPGDRPMPRQEAAFFHRNSGER